MNSSIDNSTLLDIDSIFRLYRMATDLQKSKSVVHWPVFSRDLIETEIYEHRQWKLVVDEKIACVWATTFDDPDIWEERNEDPALYIHRIATDPCFRGQQLVKYIVDWAVEYGQKQHKKYVRLDTVGENMGLINHYTQCGFDFLGVYKLRHTENLPAHYHNASVSLFELVI